jgi:lipoprotein-anchoring transpeptidase ErfK/SrfK
VSGRWVAVDLYEQTLVAYEDDTPVFATLVSTGRELTPTNEGLFDVWAKLPRDRMAGSTGAPNAYALQSVPWVMYFDDSISLHGTYWHNMFGYRHSRGCVNLSISDAKWLFDWFAGAQPNADGEVVNQVYVWSSGEYGVTATGI